MPGPVWEQNAKESRVGIGRCSAGHENRRADYTQSSTDKKERKEGRKRDKNEGKGREEKERAGRIGEDSRGEEKTLLQQSSQLSYCIPKPVTHLVETRKTKRFAFP